jgi:hypothetical protein
VDGGRWTVDGGRWTVDDDDDGDEDEEKEACFDPKRGLIISLKIR